MKHKVINLNTTAKRKCFHFHKKGDICGVCQCYIGSLASDSHRNMIKGGIYRYPKISVTEEGKLRLPYECNPMALIAEQANGIAIGGRNRILDVVPTALHQGIPFFTGSRKMVEKLQEFLAKYH